jgi:hypothetical protein
VSTNKFSGLVQISVELGEMPKTTNSNIGATKQWSTPKVKLWNKIGFGDNRSSGKWKGVNSHQFL